MTGSAPSFLSLLLATLLAALLAGCAANEPAAPGSVAVLPPGEEEPEPPECPVPPPAELVGAPLTLATFAIDNLGIYTSRDNEALACLLAPYDLVAVQNMAGPPYEGSYPDGRAYRAEAPAGAFFDAMRLAGFDYILGPEDTGPGPTNHLSSELTSWPVVFYKPQRLRLSQDKPSGYIEPDRSANGTFDRVPFALAMETTDGRYDFMLVSVELPEGRDKASRRRYELSALTGWLNQHVEGERDIFVVGSLNFFECAEISGSLPPTLQLSDRSCGPTDVASKKPNSGILVGKSATADFAGPSVSLDIVQLMYPFWLYKRGAGYPGDPLNQVVFNQYYSGHRPVVLAVTPTTSDQD